MTSQHINITQTTSVIMKKTRQFILLTLLVGAALLQFKAGAQTYQTTDWTNSFDNNGNTGLYQAPSAIYWYSIYQDYGLTVPPGTYNYPMTNDASMDADGDTNNSGSLYVYSPFNTTADQNVFYFTFSDATFNQSIQVPILLVTNISFKIHVDPSSKTDANGNFGTIKVGLINTSYGSGANSAYFDALTIPGAATNGWVKIANTNSANEQAFVNATGVTNAFGVDFDYNSYGGYPTNPVAFWIDDVVLLTSAAAPPPPPPPTMTINPPFMPGLNLFTSQGPTLYQRESLETIAGAYSWVNAGHPVSYSFNVSSYPIPAGDAFQTHIFLIPNPGTETAPDYTEPNLIFFDMESTANGASWSFRYKTNEPNGNGFVYGVGTLATINSATGVGTWTATFNNNTNITMLAPDGTSTNFSIPDTTGATTALFDAAQGNGCTLYFGAQAGNAGACNDHISVSNFKTTGLAANINDDFVADNGVLDQSTWQTNATYAPAVQLFPGSAGNQFLMVNWTSPALNYTLQYGTSLNPTNWQPFLIGGVSPTPTRLGVNFNQIINTNQLTGGNPLFFEMIQPGQ
jgi:hypothetical protein